MMKKLVFLSLLMVVQQMVFAQDVDWNVNNTYLNPGERIVAVLDADAIGQYTGVQIVGEVIDGLGNWGYKIPIITDFKVFVRFSGLSYKIIQSEKTPNIILGLRKVTDTKFHLVANCPYLHKTVSVRYRQVGGAVSVTKGDPNTVTVQGESLISKPEYAQITPIEMVDRLYFNCPDFPGKTHPQNTDYTYFYRADSIVDQLNLRLNLGDEKTSLFDIGYRHCLDSKWRSLFTLDGVGNGNFKGTVTAPYLHIEGTKNSDVKINVINKANTAKSRSVISAGQDHKTITILSTGSNYTEVTGWNSSGVVSTDSQLSNGLVLRTSKGNIRFQPNGVTEKMVLTEEGNLGIGTIAPKSKLAVNGTIRAKEINVMVDINEVGDYVFEKDYELKSLEETKKYVEANKHLPEVPSAKELSNTGMNLREMNLKLLVKVEELTLHLIEQNDRLKAQQKQIAIQNQRIEELEKK